MRGLCIFIPMILALAWCNAGNVSGQSSESGMRISLSGEDWRIAPIEPGRGIEQKAFAEGYPTQDAVAATVPGEVHWDLERAGKIPQICYGLNSQKIDWVAGKEWWYRKTFRVPSEWRGKIVRLQFGGVDYLTDVWLNARHLGRHEGQFTPFEFDVTKELLHDAENILAVQIHPAPDSVLKMFARSKNIMSVDNCRPAMIAMRAAYPYWKSMTNASWDWSGLVITMGIWKDVRLVASEEIAMDDPIVLPRLAPPYDRAALRTRVNIQSGKPLAIDLSYRVRCLTAEDSPVAGVKRIEIDAGKTQSEFPIEVENPRLWWPNGHGKQHLYEMEIVARPAGGEKVLAIGRAKFGIRDLKMLQNPPPFDDTEYIDSDTKLPVKHELSGPAPERKYLIQINGRKIFARGGNWLSCDLLFGRPRQPIYEYMIRMAAEANYNLFRAWAGGQIEKPEFYEMCDRYGIMLFQEFPNAGPWLPETDEAVAIKARETREILPLLMNHPCIVRYGGGNEIGANPKTSPQLKQLRAICNEMDPTRAYHDPDPEHDGGQRHMPYWHTLNAYAGYNGQRPLMPSSKRGNDAARLRRMVLNDPNEWTEYGPAGASCMETLKAIIPPESLWPIGPDNFPWAWHKGINAWHAYEWLCESQFREAFGELPDLETTVRCSQFWQAEGLRYANQSMRRFRWHRSACASWTFNEPWPNAAQNCIVEYLGRPKMAYYYTKQAFAPIDVLAVYSHLAIPAGKPMAVELWGVNDRLEPLANHRCRYRITDLRGKVLAEKTISAEVPAEGNVKIGAIDWAPPVEMAGDVALVWLDLLDAENQPIARHLYTFGVPALVAPKQPILTPMLKAPQTRLLSKAVDYHTTASGETEILIEIQNAGSMPAFFVKVDADARETVALGDIPPRRDWVYINDNYFSLQAKETRRVRIILAPRTPKETAVSVEAWNVPAAKLSCLPNGM